MATHMRGVLPPPPGVQPNFVNPTDQLHSNIALHTVCLTLATVWVALRLYTRVAVTKASLGWDDFLCVISWMLSIMFSGLLFECYHWGVGRHMWDVPITWFTTALKYFSIAQYIYQLLTCAIKLTILLLYYRLLWAHTTVKYFIYFGAVFVVCSNAGLLLATIFRCTPVAKAWHPTLEGHCISAEILPWLSGSLSSSTDLYILILPMWPLWRLNMALARKVRLIAIFSLGSLACAASLIRLIETKKLYSDTDAFWNSSRIAIWAVLEANVGIICASSTLLPALVDRHLPEPMKRSMAQAWSYAFSRNRTGRKSTNDLLGVRRGGMPELKEWVSLDAVELRDGDRSADGAGSTKSFAHTDSTQHV